MGKVGYGLVVVFVLMVVISILDDNSNEARDPIKTNIDDEERSLRLNAICKIGWVAGNSENHAIWPEVKPYVGVDGEYYRTFVHLRARGEDADIAANLNVQTYEQCKKDGSKEPFSEAENVNRIERVIQIANELRNKL